MCQHPENAVNDDRDALLLALTRAVYAMICGEEVTEVDRLLIAYHERCGLKRSEREPVLDCDE
jgi:hypothetical protein